MSIFNSIKEAFIRASVHNGKVRARQELINMSDRQLEDFGFSKELLLEGVKAWPWRADTGSETTVSAVVVNASAKPVQDQRIISQAINELSSYTDRELAELGVTRNGIEEAVRYGRPAVEGVFESHKHAA
ncbi:hypothetical protein [Granulosicoccus antarcticus]|uniref:DUF1127 domain-containing protein n=1 Tax=Granulosicoccus antarcticus IMCC3135 TaxID=1192854 RepID=A0A2Z2NYB2_9GAMM|nr:hypothetical protein [Granulosicoccus antarcticus]ASJ72144.1 hypothetical protein IMCC3135_10250 [Granulosicoccus antarcticus IMCC3135]